jgi:hypothetical protein
MEEIIGIMRNCIIKSFLLLLPKYYNNQIKDDKMAEESSLSRKAYTKFLYKNLKKKRLLRGLSGKIILKWVLQK